ncbi:MAG: four helix bundle protein [Chromatiaceae bacterium]|nr:four helix bundle protein [Chromatiaceae bacterium]MCP5408600.1 four helix bundle protein [Chromatiaceae bacterium]MCP5442564.1 four helix bundle protein [Chromatiaceae bacterium]
MDALQNLVVWRRACRFAVDVYRLLSDCRDYGFKDQLGRSALSIASNIAEGYERESARERAHFLKIARGSAAEAWTQLLIGMEAGFVNKADALEKAGEARQISKMLFALIRHMEDRAK